ncbi:MAG: chemotaxis protein CheB [Gemmatimonadetes bacterium]|nr:chemotaxis protein CheB [Gemmatimonadota bacterium]
MEYDLIMVGVSAGGLQALSTLLEGLPADFKVPLVLVQHRSKDSTTALCEILQDRSKLPVQEVTDKAPISPGQVYLAPADYHLLVERGQFSLSVDEPELYSRPSIDVAFESAASAYGAGVVGVVLTGANEDGAEGLRAIASRGGHPVVQDPRSAEVPRMPSAALARVPDAVVLSLGDISPYLASLQNVSATPTRRQR